MEAVAFFSMVLGMIIGGGTIYFSLASGFRSEMKKSREELESLQQQVEFWQEKMMKGDINGD